MGGHVVPESRLRYMTQAGTQGPGEMGTVLCPAPQDPGPKKAVSVTGGTSPGW